jgi:hypothetical protein
MMAIKRSMVVHQSPVIVFKGHARRAGDHEYDECGFNNLREGEDGQWGYRITRVTNSTEYRPGSFLTKDQVNKLIHDDWTVAIHDG